MLLDKTLLLKGVAGAAALGGVGGAGIYYREEIKGVFSSSSKNADAAQPEADTQGGGQDGNAASSSSTPESTEDDYGIPKRCNDASSSSCDLTQDELKKIKFEGLGEDASPEVTVENFPSDTSQKISLTIDNSSSTKKYIFNNPTSQEVKIKRGETKTITLKVGKTKFTLSGGKLKEKELGDYGEPKTCTSTCSLTADDLEDIKFKDLDGGTGVITVTPNTGTVSLEIKEVDNTKRYIFTNSSGQNVTISKGNSNTVTLTSNKKTQFTAESDSKKLNKLALDNYGIPTSCSSTCNLTADDLGEIKFEELSGTGTVSTGAGNVTLKVDSSDTSDKRFTFDNTSGSTITIQKPSDTTKSITLSAGKTRFKGNTDKLKKIVVDNYGIPNDCNSSCKLTADDLKEIKFKDLEEVTTGKVTLEPATPNPQITLTITAAAGSNPKIYTFKNSSGSSITLKKGEEKKVILENGDTEFKEDGGKLTPYEDPNLKAVNDKIGNLKFPDKCKFNKTEKDKTTKECDVTKEELQNVEFENKGSGNLTIEGASGNIKLEIKKLIKNSDKDQYGSDINDNDPLITFKNESSKITIKGSDNNNIVIPKKSNMEFLMKATSGEGEKKLSKYQKGLSSTSPSWGILCTKTSNYECTPYQTEKAINFFSDSSATSVQELKVSNGDQSKKIFTAEEDVDDYNLGFKFEVNEAISSTSGSPSLTKGDSYEIKWSTSQKKWGYVKKAK